MYLALTDEQEAVRAAADAFAREAVTPEAARIDETGLFPSTVIQKAAANGYLGLRVPKAFGGRELDHVSYALTIEAIARASATVAVILAVHNSLVAEAIARAGSDAQQKQWLRRLATGETHRRVRAVRGGRRDRRGEPADDGASRVDGGYRLDGRKVWVANGEAAGIAIVFAATEPGARGARHVGASSSRSIARASVASPASTRSACVASAAWISC